MIDTAPRDGATLYDSIIVGGGLTGGAAYAALGELFAKHGQTLALCDKTDGQSKTDDNRVLALGYGSVAILKQWRLWAELRPSAYPVRSIVISFPRRKSGVRSFALAARAVGRSAWGWTLPHMRMHDVLWRKVRTLAASCAELDAHAPYHVRESQLIEDGMLLQDEGKRRVQGRLILGAEGRGGFLASKMEDASAQQSARRAHHIIAVGVTTQRTLPHHGYWFYDLDGSGGVLVLIPYQSLDGAIAHLSIHLPAPKQVEDLTAMDDRAYAQFLAHCSQGQIVALAAKRKSFSLTPRKTNTRLKGSLLLLGDAAHQMIPLGAQGYNLSLWTLEELRRRIAKQLARDGNHFLADRSFLLDFITHTQPIIDERYAAVEHAAVGLGQKRSLARALLTAAWIWPDLGGRVLNAAAAIALDS